MTAISDLADLFLTASEHVKRADFANLFPRFVALTEDRISKALRLEDEAATVTITADANGRAALPADFREPRSIRLAGSTGHVLTGGALQVLDAMYPMPGTPQSFAIGGGYINLRPRQAADIELSYFGGIPRLTSAAPSNPMLARYPDCYLYGVVYEILLWAADIDSAAAVKAMLDEALEAAIIDNEARAYALTRVQTAGVTP